MNIVIRPPFPEILDPPLDRHSIPFQTRPYAHVLLIVTTAQTTVYFTRVYHREEKVWLQFHTRGGYRGGGGGGGRVWGLQPPLLSKFLFFLHAVLGGFGVYNPLFCLKTLRFARTRTAPPPPPPPRSYNRPKADRPPPPPPPLVESAESGQHPPLPRSSYY